MGNNLVLLRVIRGNEAIYIFETKGVNVQAKTRTRKFQTGMLSTSLTNTR